LAITNDLYRFGLGYTMETVIDSIVNDPYTSVLVIDFAGRVVFCNDTFFQVLGLNRKEVIGHHIDDIYTGGRTTKVLKTGIPEIAYVFTVNGTDFVASSHPIIRDGRTIGVLGRSIFLNMEDARDFTARMGKSEETLKKLKSLQDTLNQQNSSRYDFGSLIGESTLFLKTKQLAMAIADNDNTLLITGESGTGKDIFAKSIHNSSKRQNETFIRVNCAAIPEHLIESELFGYEKGTFTGALREGKKGKFELADKGTIFLDEIGELTLPMQSKLLIVLQEKEIERLGSQVKIPKKIDVRVIAATNRNLGKMVMEGSFRQDLYYRLNVINLELPPLRHRKEDIPLLSDWILHNRVETSISHIDTEAMELLMDYDWPGNIRELQNFIENGAWLATLEGSRSISSKHISELLDKTIYPPDLKSSLFPITNSSQLPTMKTYIGLCEKRLIEETLKTTNDDKIAAAKILDMHISSLYRKINKYSLDNF